MTSLMRQLHFACSKVKVCGHVRHAPLPPNCFLLTRNLVTGRSEAVVWFNPEIHPTWRKSEDSWGLVEQGAPPIITNFAFCCRSDDDDDDDDDGNNNGASSFAKICTRDSFVWDLTRWCIIGNFWVMSRTFTCKLLCSKVIHVHVKFVGWHEAIC